MYCNENCNFTQLPKTSINCNKNFNQLLWFRTLSSLYTWQLLHLKIFLPSVFHMAMSGCYVIMTSIDCSVALARTLKQWRCRSIGYLPLKSMPHFAYRVWEGWPTPVKFSLIFNIAPSEYCVLVEWERSWSHPQLPVNLWSLQQTGRHCSCCSCCQPPLQGGECN